MPAAARHLSDVVPGIGYGLSCDRFIRVGAGTESTERVKRGIRAIRALIDAPAPAPIRLEALPVLAAASA